MNSSDIRGYMQRFEDQGYKTWIRTTMILECLKTRLGSFLENETDVFHKALNGKIKLKEKMCIVQPKCHFMKVPTKSAPNKLCPLCDAWKREILSNYTSKNPMVYWNNTTPYLWPSHKWEVAKVYMPRGNNKHQSVDDFDISAFLTLMTYCQHFQNFVKGQLLTQVTNVRNQIMHSASFAVSAEDFQEYMSRIKALGEALGKKVPEFQSFSKDMAEIQNIDFNLQFGNIAQASTNKYDLQSILNMELKIMKDKMEYLSQSYDEDRENMLTSEELQKVKSFLDMNHDLQEKLKPQWERLAAVQAQHGQQINTLTDRVDELEKHTVATDEEFSCETLMYKNRLMERARKYKWADPVFSERDESTGFRGQVEVNGETFLGSQVCKSKPQAHQAVAKKALQELAPAIANEEAALSQAAQSQTVLQAGPSFFAAVTVSLAVDVSPDKGGSVECVYEKLVSLFGLGAAPTGLSNKEKVLQYCTRLDVPPPVERSSAHSFVLRLNGQITFYDLEGSSGKAETEQQAARAALEALCAVLDKAAVLKNNHKGALQELLVRFKQPGRPGYCVMEVPGGHGDRVTWLPGEDPTGGPAEGRPDGPTVEGTQSKTVLQAGPSFFAAVTVSLAVDVSPDKGGSVECVYEKLVSLFGLGASPTGLSNKEKVLQYCTRLDVPPPVERSSAHSFVLRLNGQITFYDLEGSSGKAETEQQAARAALEALCAVLDKAAVLKNNHKGALQELLVRFKQPGRPGYCVMEVPGGHGDRVTWLPGEDPTGGPAEGRPDGPTVEGTQSKTVLQAGPSFFAAVTVSLAVDVSPDKGGSVECVYEKLVSLFGLGASPTGLSNKEKVLQYCTRLDVPPPVERRSALSFVLRLNGQITFYDLEGSSGKAETEQQAARAALEALCAVLDKAAVLKNNHKGALQELLVRFKQPGRPGYCVMEVPGGHGDRVTWLPGEDPTGGPAEGQPDGGHGYEEVEGAEEGAQDEIVTPIKRMMMDRSDPPSKMSKVLPSTAGSEQPDGGRFSSSVQVTLQVDLQPHQAADQEGAVGAAYSDLMKALSLSPASSGEEKLAVLEFFSLTQCPPPVEKIDPSSDGTYSCSLRIDGKLTFQSLERTSTKKESESLAAQKAWAHLEGLETVKDLKLPGEVKGRLQKVAVNLGNIGVLVYPTVDAGTVTDGGRFSGSVQVTVQVDLRPHQAADQEGAVGASYSDLLKALSLSPASSGGERLAVLEFMQLTKSCPPVEDIKITSDGTYQCALKIDGPFIFQSPERTSTKREAEKLAARQALVHLEGLLRANRRPLPVGDNYKSRLQELLMAGLGNTVPPVYSAVDANDPRHT